MHHSYVAPKAQVVLRLQNELHKIIEVTPNSTISIPKYGVFSSNLLLGRPYYTTYEIVDKPDSEKLSQLRVIPAAGLHADNLSSDNQTPTESRDEKVEPDEVFDIVAEDGQVLMRNNRLTVDDPSRQQLSHEEIEELKKAGTGSGKEIISKIMAAHSALNEKTTFSLAKYTLRKSRKYMRRFTILPMDVGILIKLWLEKDGSKIMELREEVLAMIMSWANVHCTAVGDEKTSRNLVIDDSSGLIVAAMADRMGILYPPLDDDDISAMSTSDNIEDLEMPDAPVLNKSSDQQDDPPKDHPIRGHRRVQQSSATSNSITILHANTQPNISLLEHFSYSPDKPPFTHPLYGHLRALTWLQLLDPPADTLYQEPNPIPATELNDLKSGKRGAYFRKRKRWERVKTVVDETREGGFDSLVVATSMDLTSVMRHLVPLVRGGGNVVIYSPSVEPLTTIMDLYSRDRRAGYVKMLQRAEEAGVPSVIDELDFPVDPTLLLNPMLQTARAREWQVLPQRTHPLMTSRGGSEGYLFTATRVIPARGIKIEARGTFSKKRKVENAAGKVDEGTGKTTEEPAEES